MKPHRGIIILILGVLGFLVCGPFGLFAWIMGSRDLKEMDAGRMDARGRGETNTGRVIGMIATLLFVVALVLAMAVLLFAILLPLFLANRDRAAMAMERAEMAENERMAEITRAARSERSLEEAGMAQAEPVAAPSTRSRFPQPVREPIVEKDMKTTSQPAAPKTINQSITPKQKKPIEEISAKDRLPKMLGLEVVNRIPHSGAFAVSGNHAYLSGNQEIKILDISNPAEPKAAGSCKLPGRSGMIAVAARYACIVDDRNLCAVDISNPAAPRVAGACELGDGIQSLAAQGDYAYVITSDESLRIVDLSKPAEPRLAGVLGGLKLASNVAVAGQYVYVTADFNGLHIIDISDPKAPKEVGRFTGPGDACHVVIAESIAIIANHEGGFWIVDVSDPAHPEKISEHGSWAMGHVALMGQYLFALGGELDVFDITQLRSPKLACSYQGSEDFYQIIPVGKFLYALGKTSIAGKEPKRELIIIKANFQ